MDVLTGQDFTVVAGMDCTLALTNAGTAVLDNPDEVRWGFGEIEKTLGAGITVTDPNTLEINIDAADTEELGGQLLTHEGKYIKDGERFALTRGYIKIVESRFV